VPDWKGNSRRNGPSLTVDVGGIIGKKIGVLEALLRGHAAGLIFGNRPYSPVL
jgi:hypothetical protein